MFTWHVYLAFDLALHDSFHFSCLGLGQDCSLQREYLCLLIPLFRIIHITSNISSLRIRSSHVLFSTQIHCWAEIVSSDSANFSSFVVSLHSFLAEWFQNGWRSTLKSEQRLRFNIRFRRGRCSRWRMLTNMWRNLLIDLVAGEWSGFVHDISLLYVIIKNAAHNCDDLVS